MVGRNGPIRSLHQRLSAALLFPDNTLYLLMIFLRDSPVPLLTSMALSSLGIGARPAPGYVLITASHGEALRTRGGNGPVNLDQHDVCATVVQLTLYARSTCSHWL